MTQLRETVHGVALLIGETGLLVTGPPGAGKSSLALALMEAWRHDPVRLVADDRVRLAAFGGRIVARPAEGFDGLVEVRGFGIARAPAMPSGILRGVVALQAEDGERLPEVIERQSFLGVALPLMRLRSGLGCADGFMIRWPHFRALMGNA